MDIRVIDMSYYEYGRDNFAHVPGEALYHVLHLIATIQSRIENEVDELIQQGERQVAESLAAAQAGAADGGGSMGLFIAVGLIILIVLVMLAFLGRIIRSSQQDKEGTAENPLFEDQFAVHDEEIEIMTEPEEEVSTVMSDAAPAETEFEIQEPSLGVIEDHEDEPAVSEEPPQEEVTPAFTETESDSEDEAYKESENIIRLTDHTEAEAEVASVEDQTGDPYQEEYTTAEQEPSDQVAAEYEEEQQAQEEEAQEDSNVRYAFASTPRSPIAFSGISEEEMEKPEEAYEQEEPRGRPYIAPTVLREDMEKIEQHQAARMDQLRDDMTRQISALKSENNNRLDLIINSLDRKIENLAEATRQSQVEAVQPVAELTPEITGKISSLQSTLDNQGQRIRAITQILDDRLDSVSHVYGEVRNIGERIDAFNEKLAKLEQSIVARAQQDVMADVQLSDVIRSCLSPSDYEFKALLSNNNRADCLIRLPHPPGTIIIDTKFPLDAFNALPGRDEVARGTPQAKAAEDSFRRSVLRHIIDVAERYIIPGETADSALLFLPTEAIYTTLHSRFPDLVRDSFRARVWIVSPSTLMGTLQTLRGVLKDNRDRTTAESVKREAQEVMSEMESLRSRASTLAQNFERTQDELRSLLDATNKVVTRGGSGYPAQPENPAHSTLMDHLYDNKPEWPGKSADQDRDKGQSAPRYDDKNPRSDNLR